MNFVSISFFLSTIIWWSIGNGFSLEKPLLHSAEHPNLPDFDSYRSTLNRHVSCNASEYLCENGRECIDRFGLCNGHHDCDDGSDEGGRCDECQYNNGGCQHKCRNTPNGPECQCHVGWRPSHDGISCEDEDECLHGHGYCQHFCQNTEGGYSCSCAAGYKLDEDGSTCRLIQYDAGHLLFSVGHQIRNLPLNSWHHLAINDELPETGIMCDVRSGTVEGLDANNMNSYYYYTKNGGIYANHDAEICLVQGLHSLGTNIAVDWITGNLYFVNEEPAGLGLCQADGRFCTMITKSDENLGSPRGVALLPKHGLVFWTDWGKEAKIERANMDGTDRRVIVDTQLNWPNAIAIDYVHNLVYFADSEYNLVERIRLDGSHREVILKSGVFHPFDMVVFDNRIFWTDWGLYGVRTASIMNTSDHQTLYHSKSEQPYGIALLHPAYQEKDLPNPCANMTCSHLCALTTKEHSNGRVSGACLCPTNYEFRGHECVPIANSTPNKGARWCLDAFISACETNAACENGGKCIIDHNSHDVAISARCECPSDFVGEYCEISLTSKTASGSAKLSSGGSALLAAFLIFLTFIMVTCVLIGVLCRYGKYNQKIHALRWSPSVIFRKTINMASKNGRDIEQRQRIISTTTIEDGSKADLCKSDSFANPLYEEVQVPVHHAYTVYTREASTASHDSDADSGLEFNTSNGSP